MWIFAEPWLDGGIGLILLASPENQVLHWALVAAALTLSFATRWPGGPYTHAAGAGAAIWATARDMGVPFDAALVAMVPIYVVGWPRGAEWALVLAIAVNWVLAAFVYSGEVQVPSNALVPAFLTLIYVGPGDNVKVKALRTGLVLARFLVPRRAHVLYGATLFCCTQLRVPYYDRIAGAALLVVLCGLLAQLDMYAFLVLSLLLWGAQYVAQGR